MQESDFSLSDIKLTPSHKIGMAIAQFVWSSNALQQVAVPMGSVASEMLKKEPSGQSYALESYFWDAWYRRLTSFYDERDMSMIEVPVFRAAQLMHVAPGTRMWSDKVVDRLIRHDIIGPAGSKKVSALSDVQAQICGSWLRLVAGTDVFYASDPFHLSSEAFSAVVFIDLYILCRDRVLRSLLLELEELEAKKALTSALLSFRLSNALDRIRDEMESFSIGGRGSEKYRECDVFAPTLRIFGRHPETIIASIHKYTALIRCIETIHHVLTKEFELFDADDDTKVAQDKPLPLVLRDKELVDKHGLVSPLLLDASQQAQSEACFNGLLARLLDILNETKSQADALRIASSEFIPIYSEERKRLDKHREEYLKLWMESFKIRCNSELLVLLRSYAKSEKEAEELLCSILAKMPGGVNSSRRPMRAARTDEGKRKARRKKHGSSSEDEEQGDAARKKALKRSNDHTKSRTETGSTSKTDFMKVFRDAGLVAAIMRCATLQVFWRSTWPLGNIFPHEALVLTPEQKSAQTEDVVTIKAHMETLSGVNEDIVFAARSMLDAFNQELDEKGRSFVNQLLDCAVKEVAVNYSERFKQLRESMNRTGHRNRERDRFSTASEFLVDYASSLTHAVTPEFMIQWDTQLRQLFFVTQYGNVGQELWQNYKLQAASPFDMFVLNKYPQLRASIGPESSDQALRERTWEGISQGMVQVGDYAKARLPVLCFLFLMFSKLTSNIAFFKTLKGAAMAKNDYVGVRK